MRDDGQGQPRQQPTTTPPQYGFDPSAFTLQTAVEMQKSLGSIEAKLDRRISDVEKASSRITPLETAVDRVKTAFYVASALLTLFVGFAWWAIGDRITNAVHTAISQQIAQPPARNP